MNKKDQIIVQFPDVDATRFRCWKGLDSTKGPPGCGNCVGEHKLDLCRERMREHEPLRLARSVEDVAAQHSRHAAMVAGRWKPGDER